MIWLTAVTAFVCALVIVILERLAPAIGLVDNPNERKLHVGSVPLVGGLSIFIAVLVSNQIANASIFPFPLLIGGLLLIALGVVDDLKDLSARFRLVVQFSVASLMYFYGDMKIISIGPIFGGTEAELNDVASYFFTVFCTIGVINAINMIDGLDGLSGSLLLTSFLALGILAHAAGDPNMTALYIICGCLVSFLVFNNRIFRSKARVFLGDSGSMFLGLTLTWFFVKMTQGEAITLGPVSAGWIFGLPLMETVSVMAGRLLEKRSPFAAGRDHMHHRLRRAGFSVNYSVVLMLSMHMVLAAIGIMFARSVDAQPVLFWGFVVLTAVHFVISRFYLEPMGRRVADVLKVAARDVRKRRSRGVEI